MRIKVMPLLERVKNQVAKAAIEFDDFPDFQLTGFTICEDVDDKKLFVLFPSSQSVKNGERKTYYFLRPTSADKDKQLQELEDQILDVYESMTATRVK